MAFPLFSGESGRGPFDDGRQKRGLLPASLLLQLRFAIRAKASACRERLVNLHCIF
jgi:hypothetical protein